MAKLTSKTTKILKYKTDDLYPKHAEAFSKAEIAAKKIDVEENPNENNEIEKRRRMRKFTRWMHHARTTLRYYQYTI